MRHWILMLALLLLFGAENTGCCGEIGEMLGMTAAHNKVRKESRVPKLEWSDELARYAQDWANHLAHEKSCTMQHRPGNGKYGNKYGENLYWASAIRWSNGERGVQEITPEQVVRNWAQEVTNYTYATNSCKQGKACGHYTQVVWQQTLRLGCGRTVCADMSQIWVCNYDPPGNFIGQKPY